jgi:aminopeptidase N
VRLDDRSIATLKSHLGNISDGLTRAMCWAISWDMLRDAEISATDFVEIALAGLPGESDITVVTVIGNQLTTAVELYANPTKRDALRIQVADSIAGLLASAKAESDHQLQFARIFSGLAVTEAHETQLRALLDGKLAGLKVDADLRWTFVLALCERGLFTLVELDAELDRDNTINGQLGHTTCVASFPTEVAKAAAWNSLTKGDLTSSIRASIHRGFMRAGQRDLLAKYVDPYFESLLTMWDNASFDIGSSFVELCYPTYITNQATLDKTINWLATTGKGSAAGLRRLVSESRDAMSRALTAQVKDA